MDLYLSRIQLKNWKNFSSVDISLNRRSFLVGPNASGKSNFLDAVRFMHDISKPGGGLENALTNRGGLQRIRSLFARRDPQVNITIELSDTKSDSIEWQYSLSLRLEKSGRHEVLIDFEQAVCRGETIFTRPDEIDKQDPLRLTQTFLEQINTNKDFRDIYLFFKEVRYLHLIPQIIRQPELFFNTTDPGGEDAFGFHFLEILAKTTKKTLDSRLKRIENALRSAVPNFKELKLVKDDKGVPHLQAIYEHWRPNQAGKQKEDQFSDGTIRLIGILWSLLEKNELLLLEEPELSLHPAVVELLPDLFHQVMSSNREKKKQVIISTHSPDLLASDGLSPSEVLLFMPGNEGTDVRKVMDNDYARELLRNGISMEEVVIPMTKPGNIDQLRLFNE
jgi:predicted ATPase